MSDLPVTIYTPASPLKNPAALAAEMWRDLVNSRELAWQLFVRDVKAQYRQSILGYLWLFIPPLIASLPFVYLNASGVVRIADTPIPYAAYAIIGTTIWQVFADALNAPLKSIGAARGMLTRIKLPREGILLAGLAHVALGFIVRLSILIGVLMWYGLIPPATVVWVPIGILSLVLVGFVVGLVITPLGLLYGDVQQGLPIITMLLMLLTPVLYPVPQSGIAATIASLNPLTPLITSTRDWLTIGTSAHVGAFVAITFISLVFLLLGWTALRIAMPHIIARAGN